MSADKIPPGGEGEIKATVTTKGRSGDFKRRITVSSNDPKTPNFYFTIKGEIVGELTIKPARIVFANLKKSEKATIDVSVTVNEPDKIKITSVAIKNPHFKVQQKEGTPEKGGLYEVTFNGSDNLGTTAAQLIVVLEGSAKPFVEVPVSSIIFGNLSYPRMLYFPKNNDRYPPRNFVISTRDGANVTIAKIEDPDKLLDLKIERNGVPRVTISATVADQKAKHDQTFKHKLILHTDDKDEPKIEIEYRILDKALQPFGRVLPNRQLKRKIPTPAPKKP
ncbi:MAG: DUF1573 domain-containing protein [Proteobacteria bacterium]|nr:DUF1573 domain-containing protein [Pseudomonadota bacterium]